MCNKFNEEKRTYMMWKFWHEWYSSAQFNFNCYRQWATLVIYYVGGMGHSFYSKGIATQG